MAKTKQTRWVCPNGHAGVLGPTRPRMDNTCRYCLRCSEKAGKLILRTAPALEKKRAAKTEISKSRVVKKATAAEERELARYSVGERDMREILKRALTLPAFRSARGVTLKVRRKAAPHLSGAAYYWRHEISLGLSNHPAKVNAELEATGVLLHELAHIACYQEGKPFHDVDVAFADKCELGMTKWNEKYGDEIDHRMSGAYAGKIGRRNKKIVGRRRHYPSDDAKAPTYNPEQDSYVKRVKDRADRILDGRIKEIDLAAPGTTLKVPPMVWTEFEHLILGNVGCDDTENDRSAMAQWVRVHALNDGKSMRIKLPKDENIREKFVSELAYAADLHSESNVTRAYALMWARATVPKQAAV